MSVNNILSKGKLSYNRQLTWVGFGESVSVQQIPVKEGNIKILL